METAAACIGDTATLRQAGHRMRELGVTALPVCGADGTARGVISSDMIVRHIAAGGDPKLVTVAEVTPEAAGAPAADGAWAAGYWSLRSTIPGLAALRQQAAHAA